MKGYKWLLLLVIGMMLPLGTSAQEAEKILTMQQQEIEAVEKSISLDQTLQQLEEAFDANIFYKSKEIEGKYGPEIDKEINDIEVYLDILLDPRGMTYRKLTESSFVVYQKEQPENQDQAQQETISGTVTDAESGETLPGVNVMVKGTTTGTSTDGEGNFEFTVESLQDTLVVSFVGYQAQEVPIEGRTEIDVQLNPEAIMGEEMVVVGYGEQSKSDLVSSVSSVPSERLEENTSTNITQSLQASAPSVNISRGSGAPGSSGSIQIRGMNSITASNQPLIVLDGIPYSGNIRDINPNDVASMEVLKDASASAVYGSRAANGVILITTKGGDRGMEISINSSMALQNEAVERQLMDADEFYEFRKQAHIHEGDITGNEPVDEMNSIIFEENELISLERGESIDWLDEMYRDNAFRHDQQISLGLGTEDVSNYFSASYVSEQGLEKLTGFERITVRNNLTLHSVAPWLEIGNNALFSQNSFERSRWGINNQPAYYRLSPFARLYDDDGSLTMHPQANDNHMVNPRAEMEFSDTDNQFRSIRNNAYFAITPGILEGFTYRMNLGTSLRDIKDAIYWRRGSWLGEANDGLGSVENARELELTWENIVRYNTTIGGSHTFDITGLYSAQTHDFEESGVEASGFITDDYSWYNPGAAENVNAGSSAKNDWGLISYMARLNYNFQEKYYVTATARRDGYSGFATNRKYGTFPSVALAYRISNESFMNGINGLEDLKLRVSYGTTGNQAVGTYSSLARLGNSSHVFGETVVGGVKTTSLPNTDLGWERSTSLNIGADFSVIDGRITGAIDYYDTNTSDLLLSREIPKITGQNSILFNVGEVKNTGLEAELNGFIVNQSDFSWKAGVNFSTNRNEIIDIFGNKEDDRQNEWFIGEELGVIYDFEFDGIYQLGDEDEIAQSATPNRGPGDARIVDQNDDGVLNADDLRILGSTQPDWLGGLSSTFTYKNVSLYVFAHTVQGIDGRFNEEGTSARYIKAPHDYWTPNNPSNTWFRPEMSGVESPTGNINQYDASFIRIKDITFSYNLPASFLGRFGISNAKVYVNFHDYFTFSDFPFVDPEMRAVYEPAIPKQAVSGINLSF